MSCGRSQGLGFLLQDVLGLRKDGWPEKHAITPIAQPMRLEDLGSGDELHFGKVSPGASEVLRRRLTLPSSCFQPTNISPQRLPRERELDELTQEAELLGKS